MPEKLLENDPLKFQDREPVLLYTYTDGEVEYEQDAEAFYHSYITPTHLTFRMLEESGREYLQYLNPHKEIIKMTHGAAVYTLPELSTYKGVLYRNHPEWVWYERQVPTALTMNSVREKVFEPLGGHNLPFVYKDGTGPDHLFTARAFVRYIKQGIIPQSTSAPHTFHDMATHGLGAASWAAESMQTFRDFVGYAESLPESQFFASYNLLLQLADSFEYYSFADYVAKQFVNGQNKEPMLSYVSKAEFLTNNQRKDLCAIARKNGLANLKDGTIIMPPRIAAYYMKVGAILLGDTALPAEAYMPGTQAA